MTTNLSGLELRAAVARAIDTPKMNQAHWPIRHLDKPWVLVTLEMDRAEDDGPYRHYEYFTSETEAKALAKRMSSRVQAKVQHVFAMLPEYESDISCAWQVVEKMRELGYRLIMRCWDKDGSNMCHVEFELRSKSPGAPIDGEADAPEIATAICLAALAATQAPTGA